MGITLGGRIGSVVSPAYLDICWWKDVLGGYWVFLEILRNIQVFYLKGDEQDAKLSYWSGSDGTLLKKFKLLLKQLTVVTLVDCV